MPRPPRVRRWRLSAAWGAMLARRRARIALAEKPVRLCRLKQKCWLVLYQECLKNA